jgi:hypothetical protein
MAWLPFGGCSLAASDFEGTGKGGLDDGISIEGFSSLRRRLRGAFFVKLVFALVFVWVVVGIGW